jgi:4-amino-4-deoxy-L-arabinose transferase-like glycosyltransferase
MRSTELSARRQLVLLIGVTTLIRLGFAAATGLGVDESYMVAAGRVLGLGYFDHPPASWWLSWGAAHLFGTEAPLVVRLPFIALFAVSTWLMARLTTAVADPQSGVWAALLLNLSPVFGITTGTWVLPDGPLDCALLGAALCLLHALPARGGPAWGWWCGCGVCAGLALFSKYSAGLTIAGALIYLATSATHRRWLRRPEPYAAGVLALMVFAPVAVWNALHGWASFAFQGDRAIGLRFHPLAPVVTLAGEALFVLPWFWLPMMMLVFSSPSPRGRGLGGGPPPARGGGGVAFARWPPPADLPRRPADRTVCFGLSLVQSTRAVPLGRSRLPDAVPAPWPVGRAALRSPLDATLGHRHRSPCDRRDRGGWHPDPPRLAWSRDRRHRQA